MRDPSLLALHPLTAACFCLPLLLVACTRGEGDSCQEHRDCDEGLVCELMSDERGICRRPEDVEPEDAGTSDAGEPPLPPEDGGAMDSGATDSGAMDSGPVDDAGTEDDAG